MRLFRVICLLSLACVLLFGEKSLAAESTSSFNWTGPYAGIHAGYGWGNADTGFSPLPTAAHFNSLAPATLSPDPGGVIGGVQAGYNYQKGCFVFGIEADFSGSGMSGTKTISPVIQNHGTSLPGVLRAHQDINWFGTLRPRLGYTISPRMLVYGTGGLAYGEVSYSANTDFRPAGAGGVFYPASFSGTQAGWTVGGGIEYAVSDHWTVRTEYLYADLGTQSAVANPDSANPPYQVGYTWQTKTNIVSIGLNYKF